MLACLFLTLGTAVAVMIGDKVDHFAPGLGKITMHLCLVGRSL